MGKNKKMRILTIERTIEQGGGQIASLYGCLELLKLGHEVKIATIFVNLKNLPKIASQIQYLTPPRWVNELCQKNKLALFCLARFFCLS